MNNIQLFDLLLRMKANLNLRDMNGYTPLLIAASLGRLDMVKLLVENGVSPLHMDPYGNTPQDKAKLYNRFEVINYL